MKYTCTVCSHTEENLNKICSLTFPSLNFGSDGSALERDITYRSCSNCGTVSQHPLPPQEELSRYYANIDTPQAKVGVYTEYKTQLYSRRFDFATSTVTLPSKAKVAEIGSANGIFLKRFLDAGHEVLGVEPSERASTAAIDAGINTLNSDLDNALLDEHAELYDLAMSMDTLEHVTDPRSFIASMARLIKPQGFIYIEVPDALGMVADTIASCGNEVSPVHLRHFTITGLIKVVSSAGFAVKHVSSTAELRFPNLRIVAQKISAQEDGELSFSQANGFQQELYGQAATKMKELIDSGREISVWGVGADLLQILYSYKQLYGQFPQVGLHDRSPNKIGKNFLTIGCIKPVSEISTSGCIVVSPMSKVLQMSIMEDINSQFPNADAYYLFE
ncbi:class I SAM-dependent methyltransferase [Neptuniibacter sp.]|uniref:class I SAM-dependent methyltransferase n=1 Tax=Neptuniibacter sp. TaxID=1962643 RepID=UPI002635B59B|nr:class I SAM-dependent methyltransferase [Neptuniibacter sp.]MCP4595911.1 class I SAM-dependent methyltransferase [Neptuniibacter sp.]